MKYAPIIIPTYNRIEHLKRLIGSLQKNAWAKYTELYISVDYPIRAEHRVGYQAILEYVQSGIEGFAGVNIYVQEENIGSYNNMKFLMNQIFQQYDRGIYLDDDNEVSPCFIEYMDKGLELFEKDKDIFFVGGYAYNKEWNSYGGNVQKLSAKCTHVVGIWKDKYIQMCEGINKKTFDRIGKNPYYIWKLYYYSRCSLWRYVHMYLCEPNPILFDEHGELKAIDITCNIYLILNNKYSVVPLISLTRDWGKDGSGENCGFNSSYNPREFYINEEENFEYKLPIPFRMKNDNRLIQASLDGSLRLRDNIKVLQNWILRELLGYKGYHSFLDWQMRMKNKQRKGD